MTDVHSSINVFDDIQSLCKGYRRCLKRGDERRIEDHLERVGESSREMLFQNLLHIDMEFRRRRNEEPTSDDYLQRFPQFGRLIRQAFFESTMMSVDSEVDTPAVDETIVLGLPAARRLGEYELLRELGRGGFGVVYAAKHLQRGEAVALKTLPTGLGPTSHASDDAERLHKFRQEFRQLSEVNHPNLVGMQTLEVEGNQWFLTMDLVDGVDFLEYVRPENKLDEKRLRSAVKQLVAGIAALHERGIVHRDLKPSNVLVSKDGRVTILDFGLVAELQQSTDRTVSMQSQSFAGTPSYAAPEQAAGTRSAAGDWYAIGVMLYEAFAGDAPFRGTGVQIIIKKQTEHAPRLADREGVPEDLATLVDQLLQREPHARPDAVTICELVGVEDETISYGAPEDSESHASALDEIFLIGRESQLAQLESARQELLKKREPVVVFISGRSGEGKTSLVEKFLSPLRRDNEMLVLSGRCYDRESVPFKAIDCIIDALVAFLRSRKTDEVLRLLPDDIHMLTQLFPVLRRVEAIADRAGMNIAGIDSRQIRYRAFAALRELLASISRFSPVVLFIDDLQWGDGDSAGALFELLPPPNPPAVMLLGSFRSDEADESPFLTEWRERSREADQRISELTVEVSPLTEEQCISFFAARVGQSSDALQEQARELFQGTQGNPYFLEQLIEGFDVETGQFQAIPLDEIIDRKLQRLPNEATALLEAIAIAGQAVKLDEAAQVSDQSSHPFATTTHMRSERLLRLIGSSEQQLVDTYHDKIRETVLDGLQASKRRELHIRFGEFLEQTEDVTAEEILAFLGRDTASDESKPETTDRIYDLAYHFHAAGDSRRFSYQLMAGELSFRAYASEDAVEFLRRAEATLPDGASDGIRYRLLERLATSLSRLGEFEPALSCYEAALPLASNASERAIALNGIGELHGRESNYDPAYKCYEEALVELGFPRPKSLIMLLMRTTWSLCQVHIPWLIRKEKTVDARRRAQIAATILNNIAWLDILRAKTISFAGSSAELVTTSYRSDRPGGVARALTWFAFATGFYSLHLVARQYVARAMRFAKLSNNAVETAIIDSFSGGAAFSRGDLDEAENILDKAIGELQCLGASSFFLTMAYHLRRHLCFVQGDSRKELEAAKNELRLAESVGDRELMCWGRYGVACAEARMGRLMESRRHMSTALDGYEGRGKLVSKSVALYVLGFLEIQSSRYDEAVQAWDNANRVTRETLFYTEFTAHIYPSLIEGLVGPDWLHFRKDDKVKRARRLVLLTRFVAWRFSTIRPHTLRVLGRLASVTGRPRRAARYFEKSILAARQIRADFALARSLLGTLR